MPARVSRVRWKCRYCGKSHWAVPSVAADRRYCDNTCKAEGRRVEHPVRAKQSAKPIYDERPCEQCHQAYRPKTLHQRFCTLACQHEHLKGHRKTTQVPGPRPCEYCGKVFVPRQGSAGRYHSWECKQLGQRGAAASGWKGGRVVRSDGYVFVVQRDHPKASKDGYVLEHRLVMERQLGRPLTSYETVHHINGDRADNRPENLQFRSGRHGKGVVHRCADCGSYNIVEEHLSEAVV